MIAHKTQFVMKKIFTLFLSTLFSSFLFGQDCPTSVNSDHKGRIHFHFDTPDEKEAAWDLFPSKPTIAVTINNVEIGDTKFDIPLALAKGAGGVVKNNTEEYFRTYNPIVPLEVEKVFSGTITLHYTTGNSVCNYENGLVTR